MSTQGWKRRKRRWEGRGRGSARALGVFAAALWLGGAAPFTAPPARAAAEDDLCTGRLVKVLPLPAGEGEVRVYKSRARVCALTLAWRPGERRRMAVSVQPRGGVPVADAGRFTRYAGPVTVGAISRCVYVRGNVAAGSVDSGWFLC
ncbi:hypothetical protein ABZ934_10745 [Streptomyces sp. NPDC046557]|uniref:hypothetical protein n=1 Tax=Streptomyces sp. NPDC046557 TaxID=3155372 RepID=UPI0033FD96E6